MYRVYKRHFKEDFLPGDAISYLTKLDKTLAKDLGNPDKLNNLRRQYAIKFHPDKGHDTQKMQLINQAFDVLSKYGKNIDKEKREKDPENDPFQSWRTGSYQRTGKHYQQDYYPEDPKGDNGTPIWNAYWWSFKPGYFDPHSIPRKYEKDDKNSLLYRGAWILAGRPEKLTLTDFYEYQLYSKDRINLLLNAVLIAKEQTKQKNIPLFLNWCFTRPYNTEPDEEDIPKGSKIVIVSPVSNRADSMIYIYEGNRLIKKKKIKLKHTSQTTILGDDENLEIVERVLNEK